MAAPFSEGVGTKVPLTLRFSTVAGESGSPDTNRDPRGFAIKLRTSKGIWDWVFNNTPVFFLRHVQLDWIINRYSRTIQGSHQVGLVAASSTLPTSATDSLCSFTVRNAIQRPIFAPQLFNGFIFAVVINFFLIFSTRDYWSQNQEAIGQVMRLFSNRGTPKSWAQMDGFSGHTFKFVTASGSWHYVKIKATSKQGIENFNATTALQLAASNPDYLTQELRERIDAGNFPTWEVGIQTMTLEESKKFPYDVNDLTKVWPEDQFPVQPVGNIVLNKNPQNWFAEIEQLAFSPGNLPPGVEPSNDPVLQSRIFSYPDTARHRLGPNHLEIPINCPVSVNNFQRAAWMRVDGGAGNLAPSAPNYPSSFASPVRYAPRPYDLSMIADPLEGPALVKASYKLSPKDFEQPNQLFNKEFSDDERSSMIANVITALNSVTVNQVKQRSLDMFACVDPAIAQKIGAGIGLKASSPLSCGK
ncbi:Catalase domain-containing protein [Mycena indigotica]|uniref:Catalase domain-containing protein n=1 Tax=Mycena indigotica TaxID=2126181 RepID=A0A8H6WER4_9AGAR|nr:Catalase domain-containing protein [Mycena indigotica]KAF7309744.1 Catalase domain-containing protein [Mycena indigotica]